MVTVDLNPTGVRKSWFSWVFRGSALLHFLAAICMLFVLVQAERGSIMSRSMFIFTNETLVIVSWVSTLLSILSMIGTFTILTFALDKTYRPLLQWAWMISMIGGAAIFLYHLIQMTIFPALSEMIIRVPTLQLAEHMYRWDQLLWQIAGVFSPTCFAISGLIYTAVMFRTRDFSIKLSWWSFAVWTLLLFGAVSFHWIDGLSPKLFGILIFIYIPWLWFTGEQVKPQFT